ncbi:MAG: hypothetical protein E7301_02505 [Butyrivibrio sp.]|nr:hypothetical protein [Butyrivibrio sp.]
MKRNSIFYIFGISWIIPIVVLLSFIFNQYQNAYIDRTESEVMNAVNISGVLVKSGIDTAISKINRQTSTEEWRGQYRKVQTGELSMDDFLIWIKLQLISRFRLDEQFSCTAFYLNGQDDPKEYVGKSGFDSEYYMKNVNDSIKSLIQNKEKKTQVVIVGNQIYILQNLFFSIYDISYGTLVVGLEGDSVLKDVPIRELENVFIEIDKTGYFLRYENDKTISDIKLTALSELRNGTSNNKDTKGLIRTLQTGFAGYRYHSEEEDYILDFYYLKDMGDMYYEISRLNLIVIFTVVGMIPIMFLCLYYMKKNTEYVQHMAIKDAQIAALQAQINPHFLNNTLEMMNWQARMNGDSEISKMIEALGTVLDSGINRNQDKLVRLSDEVRCADAFLYIMSMRFGSRLQVEKLIDTNLTQAMVPQLILQPILENAIKHGVESVSEGAIWLNIFEENKELIIDVINSGKKMTQSDIERISRIISGEEQLNRSVPGVHTSIGIYNVNKRIELIFGEKYGLSVHLVDEDKLQFRMIMPLS